MKQNISLHDLNSLTDDQRAKLHNWFKKTYYPDVRAFPVANMLLSIGEMIEFLYDHMPDYVDKVGYPNIFNTDGKEDLCAVLFEAVKEILNDTSINT